MFEYERQHLAMLRPHLADCCVLLKKDGKFPLDGPCKLAAYGNGVRGTLKGGTGSGEVNSRYFVTAEMGLVDAGFELVSKDWLEAYDMVRTEAKKAFIKQIKDEARAAHTIAALYGMGAVMPEPEYGLPLLTEGAKLDGPAAGPSSETAKPAADAAKPAADAAIYVLSRICGEGSDRKPIKGDFKLTDTEVSDILALSRAYDRFMLVLNVGGPVDLSPVTGVQNILVLSQLGVDTGAVLADILLGRTVPSGKLATTWSAFEDYCPDIDLGDPDDTYYREGIYVGYRWFDTAGKEPLYPFGYGLSYTEFEIGGAAVSSGAAEGRAPDNAGIKVAANGTLVRVSAAVRNVGKYSGRETVQLYVSAPQGRLDKPFQQLAGFAKTRLLAPGESQTVEIEFDLKDIASFDAAPVKNPAGCTGPTGDTWAAYVLEWGSYVLRLGNSSRNTEPAAVLELDADAVTRVVPRILQDPGFEDKKYGQGGAVEADPAAEIPGTPAGEAAVDADLATSGRSADSFAAEGAIPVIRIRATNIKTEAAPADLADESLPAMGALTDKQLAELCVGNFAQGLGAVSVIGEASSLVAGAAGQTCAMGDLPAIVMADGPAGLRLAKKFYRDAKGAHALGGATMPESISELLPAPLAAGIKLLGGGKDKTPKNCSPEFQYATAIPIGTALAQSWDLEFARLCGDIVGDEMQRFGVQLWLAPALNIHRSVLCGRNFEYFSEDPLISGKMAAALTLGVQSHPGCGATIKHYAANNQEKNRMNSNSRVSERAMREIYLRGFEICVKEAQPKAVMTSYNLLNGEHTSESAGLIRQFLRCECGFAGIVMTDWVIGIASMGKHKYRGAKPGCVAKAGGDLFMPGSKADMDDILSALKKGELSRSQLVKNASRVIKMAWELNSDPGE